MLLVLSCFLFLGVGWCGEGGGGEGTLFIAGWVGNRGWRAARGGAGRAKEGDGLGARGRTGEGRFVVAARAEGGRWVGGWPGGRGRRPGRPSWESFLGSLRLDSEFGVAREGRRMGTAGCGGVPATASVVGWVARGRLPTASARRAAARAYRRAGGRAAGRSLDRP